jgi:hypothetical protein
MTHVTAFERDNMTMVGNNITYISYVPAVLKHIVSYLGQIIFIALSKQLLIKFNILFLIVFGQNVVTYIHTTYALSPKG